MVRRVTFIGLLALFAASRAGAAWAQAGYYVYPSLSLTETYDDNVFGTSHSKNSDFMTLITPSLAAGYQSEPFTLLASYALGAEIFAKNSDLTGLNRHQAGLTIRYLPNRLVTLGLVASYSESRNTSQFFFVVPGTTTPTGTPPEAPSPPPPAAGGAPPAAPVAAPATAAPAIPGVEVGRERTTQIGASPSVSYALTSRTSVDASYGYTRTEVSGTSPSLDPNTPATSTRTRDTEHAGSASLAHQLTAFDRVSLNYRPRYFESDAAGSTTSHAVTLGYFRQVTEQLDVALELGPRFGDGMDVEASARVNYRFRLTWFGDGRIGLAYNRTQGIVTGRTGAQTEDLVSATVNVQPLRQLQLGLAGSFLHSSGGTSGAEDTTVYAVGTHVGYQLTSWMALRLDYSYSLEEQRSGNIPHHIVSVGVDLYYPLRVY